MTTDESLCLQPIIELATLIRERRLSPVELATAYLRRIESVDPLLSTYISVWADSAMAQASVSEREIASGRYRGPLHGVPIGLKDLIDVAGEPTTAASEVYRDERAHEDARLVTRLREAGAVLLGKHSLYEFATGLARRDDPFPPARNPWNRSHIPGGSSSGSAAAVAAGLCAGAMGTDTGGSIRGPAAYCGVVGLKPSYDAISRDGVVPLAWSLDHVGPITRRVADVRLIMSAVAEWWQEPSSATSPTSPRGIRIGVPTALVEDAPLERDVSERFWSAIELLKSMGYLVEDVELPSAPISESVLLVIMEAESFAFHEQSLGISPGGFGSSARARLSAGADLRAADYINAQRARVELIHAYAAGSRTVNAIATPVTLRTAPSFDEHESQPPGRTPFTGLHNLVGAPSISVPCGLDGRGLPVGLLLSGAFRADAGLLEIAESYELEAGYALRALSEAEFVH